MACSSESSVQEGGEVPAVQEHVVGFQASMAEGGNNAAGSRMTRAAGDGELTTDLLHEKGFGVYCWYTGTSDFSTPAAATYMLMRNQKVEYSETSGLWGYTPSKYWPLDENEKLTFRAYAPYVSYMTDGDYGIADGGTYVAGMPLLPVVVKADDYRNGTQHDPLWGTGALTFTHETDPYLPDGNQYGTHYTDITYAKSGDYRTDPEGGDTHNGTIHWFFHHGMAKLVLNISIIADPGCESVTITNITIEDLYKQGLLDLNSPTASASDKPWWYDCSGDIDVDFGATDFASNPFTIDTRTSESATAVYPLLADGKGLLIIPKNFSSTGMKVSIEYSIDDEGDTQTAEGTISQNFQGNTIYTLNMRLTPETKSMEIDVVWAAFTTWTAEPEKEHTIYNW